MKIEIWFPIVVSAYAAIVATGALFLEVRRWFETKARLVVTIIPEGLSIGGGPEFDEKDICIVNVVNRGQSATMITNLLVFEIESLWQRIRVRPVRSFIVAKPELKGYPPNIPSMLEPNKRWTGVIRRRDDILQNIDSGNFYVGIAASHTDKIILKRITKPHPAIPKNARKA